MAIKYTKRAGGPIRESVSHLFDKVNIESDGIICGVHGCSDKVAGRGLCRKHYARVRRHGRIDGDNKFAKKSHPMHALWNTMRQRNYRCERWKNFWLFVEDVGERPTKFHVLRRLDASKDAGPDNFKWSALETTEKVIDGNVIILRRTRSNDPSVTKRGMLAKYGITPDEYGSMLKAQNGCCAICKEKETYTNGKTGREFALAVDHEHSTGIVRGLLCAACNRALGLMQDSPKRLASAVAYLGRAQANTSRIEQKEIVA